MIDCDWAEPRLSAWFDGELVPDDARAVMAHVERCPVCERRRRLLVASSRALRALGRVEERASFSPRAAARSASRRRSRAAWLLAAAALIALGVGALSLHVSRSRPAIANDCGHCGPEKFPVPARDTDVAQKR